MAATPIADGEPVWLYTNTEMRAAPSATAQVVRAFADARVQYRSARDQSGVHETDRRRCLYLRLRCRYFASRVCRWPECTTEGAWRRQRGRTTSSLRRTASVPLP